MRNTTTRNMDIRLDSVTKVLSRVIPKPLVMPVATAAGYQPAETLGWGVVNAIERTPLNTVLKKAQPPRLPFSTPLGANDRIAGAFGQFEIASGGDGENVNLSIPIVDGQLDFEGNTYPIAPATLTIQVVLEYVPGIPDQPGVDEGGGISHALQIGTHSIFVLSYDYGGTADQPAFLPSLIKGALGTWFDSHGDALTGVRLATVTLGRKSPSFEWLSLKYASYAYQDDVSGDNGVLAVLGTTLDQDHRKLFHELAPDVIPAGSGAALLVSAPQFFENAVLPGLAHVFTGATTDDFEIEGDGAQIALKTGHRLQLPPVSEGGDLYEVFLESFDLTAENQQIVTRLEAKTTVSAGVDLYIDITTYQGLQVVNKPDGSLTLGYVTTRPTVANHRIHNSTGADIGKVLLTLILSLAGGIAGALAEKVAAKIIILIIASLIKGAVAAVEALVPTVLDKGIAAAMPSVADLVAAIGDSVAWAGGSGFQVSGAQLNGSVQFYGGLKDG